MAPLPDEDPSLQHKDVKNHPFYTEKAPFDELAMEKSYARAARMIKETREVRVFVSSTFRDYNEEREGIVKRVCPGLRDLCQQRGCMYTEIDLRTGTFPCIYFGSHSSLPAPWSKDHSQRKGFLSRNFPSCSQALIFFRCDCRTDGRQDDSNRMLVRD
jgi:hypothetical protein